MTAPYIALPRGISAFCQLLDQDSLNSSGSFGIFTAIRRALSLVSSFGADRRPGSS